MELMKLLPAGKDYLWGGTRLRDEFGKKIDLTPLAETWECSVHPDGPSVIANGKYSGRTLAEVLKEHPEYLGTKVGDTKELPVLVKFIDAKKDLLYFVKRKSPKSERKFPIFGKGNPYFRKKTIRFF